MLRPASAWHRIALTVWVILINTAAAGQPPYRPTLWNRSCNYTLKGVPISYFLRPKSTNPVLGPLIPLRPRPLSINRASDAGPAELCFNASEPYNETLVAAGSKLPCGYQLQPGGKTVTYWEEAASPETLLTNCYCYALNRYMKGYCTPGLRKMEDEVAVTQCSSAVQAVVADGARPVTRHTVYHSPPPSVGHYIALAVWPGSDFHFWRLDAGGAWSGKRGDTFVSNTLPNSSLVTDVEDPSALGLYSAFCGYFYVDPKNVTLVPTGFSAQSIPWKVQQARSSGISVTVTPLQHPSWGWARQNYAYLLFGLDAAMWESGNRPLPWGYKGRGTGMPGKRQLLTDAATTTTSSSSESLPRTSPSAAAGDLTAAAAAAVDPVTGEPLWLSRIRWHLQPPTVQPIDWSALDAGK